MTGTRLARFISIFVLAAAMLQATVYEYPISGNTGNPRDQQTLIVDTESPDFTARIKWVNARAGLQDPIIRDLINFGNQVAGGNVTSGMSIVIWGQACWQSKTVTREACIDVRGIAKGPEGPMHALAALNILLDLGMSEAQIKHLRYEPPAPPTPKQDWEVEGSPLGQPFGELVAGQPAKFRSKFLGNKEGDKWTGPSGATYEFQNIGGIFRYMAWVRR